MSEQSVHSEIDFSFVFEHKGKELSVSFTMIHRGDFPLRVVLLEKGHLEPSQRSLILEEMLFLNTIVGSQTNVGILQSETDLSEDLDQSLHNKIQQQLAHFAPQGLELKLMSQEAQDAIVGDHILIVDERFLPGTESISVTKLANAWSMAESARHFYNLWGGNMNQKRLVAGELDYSTWLSTFYLGKHNAALIAFTQNGLHYYNGQGWTPEEIALFNEKLPVSHEISQEKYLDLLAKNGAEMFIDNSDLTWSNELTTRLNRQGYELHLVGRATHFLPSQEFESALQMADNQTSTLPRFITLSGAERLNIQLKKDELHQKEGLEYLFEISQMIEAALVKVNQFNMKLTGIRKMSIHMANKMLNGAV